MTPDHAAAFAAQQGRMYGFAVQFSFPVHFTRGLFSAANTTLVDTIRDAEPSRRHRVLFIVDGSVAASNLSLIDNIQAYCAAHAPALDIAGAPLVVGGGEQAKADITQALPLLQHMEAIGLDRQSFVVVIGGGAVLDVGSFAAAIAHRGIRTIRVPTTVLSQDDSGVAVKTSVNMFGKKNFAGTFTPPFAVINDFDFLDTLSRRDRIAGLSEAVKVALLREPALFDYIETHAEALADGEHAPLEHVVRRSAQLHLAHICGNGDPFEMGSARPLDFGHWSAHKLEAISGHRIRHGEAVAMGIALDVTYAVRAGHLAQHVADRILAVLESLELPLWDEAFALREPDGTLSVLRGLQEFREHLGGELHVTLVRGIGDSFEVTSIDEDEVCASIALLEQRDSERSAQWLATGTGR